LLYARCVDHRDDPIARPINESDPWVSFEFVLETKSVAL
jgi:hypothetical protein